MKKVLVLMFALVLVLCSTNVLAISSKTNNDIAIASVVVYDEKGTQIDTPYIKIEIVEDTEDTEAVKTMLSTALETNDVKAVLPEEVQAEIPEEYTEVNEVVSMKLSGDTTELSEITVNYIFETLYVPGDLVMVAYCVPTEDGLKWIVVEGTVQADGSVSVVLNAELMKLLLDKTVPMVVFSKA